MGCSRSRAFSSRLSLLIEQVSLAAAFGAAILSRADYSRLIIIDPAPKASLSVKYLHLRKIIFFHTLPGFIVQFHVLCQ